MKLTDKHVSEDFIDELIRLNTSNGEGMPHPSTDGYKLLIMALELKQRRAEDRAREVTDANTV